MARKKTATSPPTAEACEYALERIRSTAEPLTAAQLVKLLEPPHKIREKDLIPVLDEAVLAGRLHRYPGKTAKGKPRYWDRDAYDIARTHALDAMRQAETPLTAKELTKAYAAPIKLTEDDLTAFLDEQVAAGTLFAIPRKTAKGKPRYWNQNVVAYGSLMIRETLAAKGPQTETVLKRAVKGASDAEFRKSLEETLAARQAWRHPPVGRSKKGWIGANPPSPEPYLREMEKQLRGTVDRLDTAGVSPEVLRRAVVQMVEAAGITLSAGQSTRTDEPSAPPATTDLIALMSRIEPGAPRGALVKTRDLRAAAHLEKPQFDRAVLELARQGRVSLHRHDYPSSLSEREQSALVSDGNGNYYVGVAMRPRD